MKFDKRQKKWLKANGYWKKLKANRSIFRIPPDEYTGLEYTVSWKDTAEGFDFWGDVNARMIEDLRNAPIN